MSDIGKRNAKRPVRALMLAAIDAANERAAGLPPAVMTEAEIEAGLADVFRRAELLRAEHPVLDEAGLVAFIEGRQALSQAQQQALFSDAKLRARYQALKAERAVKRAGRPVLDMPAQIAAATQSEAAFARTLGGGKLRVEPVGIEAQIYVIIDVEDDVAPAALVLERARDAAVVRLDLPPAEDGQIVLIRDLAVAAEAALVEMLRDPTTTGVFLA
jgi:hypothetical protein